MTAPRDRRTRAALRRVRITFWALVVVAVLAAGGLSRALSGKASPAAGLGVAVAGLTLVVTAMLALRILGRLDGRR